MTPDLITRLSEADGPSRELDKAIVLFLYPDASIQPYCADLDVPTVFHAEPLIDNKGDLPRFTESLDAALTLVPDGCAVRLQRNLDMQTHWAEIQRRGDDDRCLDQILDYEIWVESGNCKTFAIALCIAALKARSYQEREG